MLVIKNEEVLEHEGLKKLLKDFRRVQVSRFPLEAHCWQKSIRFFDSRFTKKDLAAFVEVNEDGNGNELFILTSRLITNDRFVRGNERRNQKQTKDPKKLLRYMREYVLPFKPREIAEDSFSDYRSSVYKWTREAGELVSTHCYVDRDMVMEELIYMKSMGYQPHTQKFRDLMENGVPAYLEMERRNKRQIMRVHVFFNPDETVEIFCPDKMGYANIIHGTTAYASIAEAPMSVQHGVAMLRMLDAGGFIPEVGHKVDDKNYWVEVFPE